MTAERAWHRIVSRVDARRRRSRTLRNRANRVLRLAGLNVRVKHDPYCAYVEAPHDPAVRAALEGAGWVAYGPISPTVQAWAIPWPERSTLGRKAARRMARFKGEAPSAPLERIWVPYCSTCGDLVGRAKHAHDEGTGPYCPGCRRAVAEGPTAGCVCCEGVAILQGAGVTP